MLTVYLRNRRGPASCADCGLPSSFGYSARAESPMKEITRVCLECLKRRLDSDYRQFRARALVIEPAAGFPVYVFQPCARWADSKLSIEAKELLSRMTRACVRCDAEANFFWIESKGLSAENFPELFDEGFAQTLVPWGNQAPRAVCGRCCVDLIHKSMSSLQLTFLEVCGPREEDGFVLPMGY